MNRGIASVTVAALWGLLSTTAGAADPAPVPHPIPVSDKRFVPWCTPTVSGSDTVDRAGLAELSGLAWHDGVLFAIGDSGSDDRVLALDAECRVRQGFAVTAPHEDVEDLANGGGGRLWLSDTGDNLRNRASVAVIGIEPGGSSPARVHQFTYPDGPHDAETLLVGRDGRPVIVTKELLGDSGAYVPADGTTVGSDPRSASRRLVRAATVRLGPTDTPGGPLPLANSVLITGGAVSHDGTVFALRTYTDVYLYSAPDGDLVSALARPALRVPLPDQPQGEAIAFTDSGDLIAGSEAGAGPLPPLVVLRGATGLVDTVHSDGGREQAGAPIGQRPPTEGTNRVAVASAATVLVVLLFSMAGGVAVWFRRR